MKLLLILVSLIIVEVVILFVFPTTKKPIKTNKCSKTCSALADVNNPEFNIKEVIKNTLLIEDHLADKAKYCKECLVKHFLLSISYLQESIWMACDNCDKYPKLKESVQFYDNLFKQWNKNMDDDSVRLDVLGKLRAWRQEMIRLYFFDIS